MWREDIWRDMGTPTTIIMESRRPYNYEKAETLSGWLKRPWPGKLGGCYDIVREYYREYYDRELYDYAAERKFLFHAEYIEAEQARQGGFDTIYTGDVYDDCPISLLEEGDVMIMKLYYDRLEGGYSDKAGRTCNHCGIYVGDGYMLHHPMNQTSRISDLIEHESYFLQHTELVLRLTESKNISNPI